MQGQAEANNYDVVVCMTVLAWHYDIHVCHLMGVHFFPHKCTPYCGLFFKVIYWYLQNALP